MVAHINLTHPRIVRNEDDKMILEPLPMSTKVGTLFENVFKDKPEFYPFDQLGLGVTLYFKMIRLLIIVLVISTFLAMPYMFVYNSGNEAKTAQDMDKKLGAWSLGNVGQSLDKCVMQDIEKCDTVDIHCPEDSEITELRAFGLGDKAKNQTCPATISRSTSIDLNLIKGCDYPFYLEKKK